MTLPRVPLYTRLPEIYRIRDEAIRDEEHLDKGPLQAYLEIVEEAFGAIHASIEALYDDFFIETSSDWAIPYIGDLLGTTALSGDAWTRRADVADTIALRRRKGTRGAIELLTHNLTRWGVRCVELRENLVWHQHLNHQRPDLGGRPPYGDLPNGPGATRMASSIRGGTVSLRDPALLSLLGSPFDPFGHLPDVRAHTDAAVRYNLPNLAVFLWRMEPYRIEVSRPGTRDARAVPAASSPSPDDAAFVARFDVFQVDRPVRLFNVRRFDSSRALDADATVSLTLPDEAPGPILRARLSSDSEAGNPLAYVSVQTYDPTVSGPPLDKNQITDRALQLYLPAADFAVDAAWTFRGANLCAWEEGLRPALRKHEIAIDPEIGRIAIGVETDAEADALRDHLLLSFTYGAVGPVGAHPIARENAQGLFDPAPDVRAVRLVDGAQALRDQLSGLSTAANSVVVEVQDNGVHDLDIASIGDVLAEGGANLQLQHDLVVRAASGARPVVRLKSPLRFRPVDPAQGKLTVRLEGLLLMRGPGFPAGEPLIARAALNRLEVHDCTLDAEHYRDRSGDETAPPAAGLPPSLALSADHGFANPNDGEAFKETPLIEIKRSITGPLLLDPEYTLEIRESIVDGGAGVGDVAAGNAFAVSAASDPANGWGPPLTVEGATFFGRCRVQAIDEAEGGVWVHALEVENDQAGCIKYSYFSGEADRLPQNHACVSGPNLLRFTSDVPGDAAYAQLSGASAFDVRERGPGDDQMGAYGFLLEAHRFRNLQIRYREFMPLGIRPLLIPVT